MAAELKINLPRTLALTTGAVSEERGEGTLAAFIQTVQQQPLVVFEVVAKKGASSVLIKVPFAYARKFALQLMELTGGPGDQHGS